MIINNKLTEPINEIPLFCQIKFQNNRLKIRTLNDIRWHKDSMSLKAAIDTITSIIIRIMDCIKAPFLAFMEQIPLSSFSIIIEAESDFIVKHQHLSPREFVNLRNNLYKINSFLHKRNHLFLNYFKTPTLDDFITDFEKQYESRMKSIISRHIVFLRKKLIESRRRNEIRLQETKEPLGLKALKTGFNCLQTGINWMNLTIDLSTQARAVALDVENRTTETFIGTSIEEIFNTRFISSKDHGERTIYKYSHPTAKEIALIVFPTSDWNGGFAVNYFVKENLLSLSENYSVEFAYVSNPDEIEALVRKNCQMGPIKLLQISGHGDPESIQLSDNKNESITRATDLSSTFDLLHPQAVIVLVACETGKLTRGVGNIAQVLAQQAKGKRVYAPKDISSSTQVHYPSTTLLTCKFSNFRRVDDRISKACRFVATALNELTDNTECYMR